MTRGGVLIRIEAEGWGGRTGVDDDLLFLFIEIAFGVPPGFGARGALGHEEEGEEADEDCGVLGWCIGGGGWANM